MKRRLAALMASAMLVMGLVPAPAWAQVAEQIISKEDVASGAVEAQGTMPEEESQAFAATLREQGGSNDDLLAAAWDAIAGVAVADEDTDDVDGAMTDDEAVHAALVGQTSTSAGVARAFALVADALGFSCEVAGDVDGVVRLTLDDSTTEMNVAQGVPGEYPWLDDSGDDADNNASADDEGDEAADKTEDETSDDADADGEERGDVAGSETDEDTEATEPSGYGESAGPEASEQAEGAEGDGEQTPERAAEA
ncbi:MAG: hypothetical protein IKG21_03720, partial [Atopobiaceae bacterium]|nr:hypothetical protein [Atopobiaceae bacterium]